MCIFSLHILFNPVSSRWGWWGWKTTPHWEWARFTTDFSPTKTDLSDVSLVELTLSTEKWQCESWRMS